MTFPVSSKISTFLSTIVLSVTLLSFALHVPYGLACGNSSLVRGFFSAPWLVILMSLQEL